MAAIDTDADGSLNVVLGRGDGTFAPAVVYFAGTDPRTLTSADFNSDGKIDLAIAGSDNTVSIMLGKGNGTFAPVVEYLDPDEANVVIAADFNNDGKIDLATANAGYSGYFPCSVSILLGKGDGTFAHQTNYPTNDYSGPPSITAADLNNDGKIDLATADNVSILLGKGDGTFVVEASYLTGNRQFSVTAADFNSDGNIDLATADYEDSTVSILLGKGDGTFVVATSINF